MKHWMKQITAAGLSLSLLLGQAALASDALGHDLHAGHTALSEGAGLTRAYFWSDTYKDLRTERYVSYTPNEDVKPTVAYGDTVLKRATLSTMARGLEAQGKRVVGGTNGDFYVFATGQPLGLVVTDGILRSSASYHSAVGFRADGTAFVGTPNLLITATMLGERITVFGGVNKIRQVRSVDGGGLTLLTRDFGETTQNTSAGVDVILRPVAEDLGEVISAEDSGAGFELTLSDMPRIGGRVRCTVDQVIEAAGDNPIPEGCFVLTMNAKDDEGTLNMLRSLQPGDEVNIDITSEDTRWAEATEALGAMYRLLDNGQVGANLNAERTARTAIGVKEDGTVIFYTVDGKQAGVSVGATCAQVAMRLQELGCVEAVGLDGGGSTTIGVTYPDKNYMEVVNSPSDGAERSNSTAIFLTTELKATGEPGSLALSPGDALLLAGAQLSLSAGVLDTAYYSMGTASGVTYTAEGAGEVTPEGVFTADASSGSAVVTGTGSGGVTGRADITVVDTPDQIVVKNEATGGTISALSLDPGETVSLTASSGWRNLLLQSQDGCYTWKCDEAVGSITEDGTFTAGTKSASGNLTVTAGGKTVAIPVNVAGHVKSLEDMEGTETGFTSTDTATAEIEKTLNNVRTGLQSLKVDYDTGEEGTAQLDARIAIPGGEHYLGLWVLSDGSGNNLTAVFENAGGEELLAPVAGLSFTGWKHVLVAIPEGAAALTGLSFIYGGGENRTGTVWLDQLTSSNEDLEDTTPPTIDIRVKGIQLTATVNDNVDRSLSAGAVVLQYDGATLTGSWNEQTGTLTATLPAPGAIRHRVTVTAVDASGNLGRASLDVGEGATLIFDDMEDHWAAGYANYLYEQGVTKGATSGDVLNYLPDTDITRAEFFTMVARWMGLDLSQYEGVSLPFADTKDIPSWALSAVKAMYDRGIVQGSQEFDGLYAHPNDSINRAEAMTILGRTQMRGYPEAEITGFTDYAQVPAWSEAYVRSLVGQGVVNGYEDNTLRPLAPMSRGQVAKVLYTLR